MHTYWRISKPGATYLDDVIDFILAKGCLKWDTVAPLEEHDGFYVLDLMVAGSTQETLNEIKRYTKIMMGIDEDQWHSIPEPTLSMLRMDVVQRAGTYHPRDLPEHGDRNFGLINHAVRNEALKNQRDVI
jgi:hypothetical protein